MLNWFRRKTTRSELPEYSAVRSVPTRGLPADLASEEASESFSARCDEFLRSLCEPPGRPPTDRPLFVELLAVKEGGVLTITLPEGGAQCLPVFSSPFRAADYIRTLLVSGPSVTYLSSSPLEFVGMLRDLSGMGIEDFALDRCPRCDQFTTIGSEAMATADDAITCWSISKATELARLDLYLSHARTSARAGQLDLARDVVLETVAHVNLEHPRAHLLLGQIAVALKDGRLLREAKAFLQFLKLEAWERKLDDTVQSGSPDFEYVE